MSRIPDWLIYGLFVAIILGNAIGRSESRPGSLPAPDLGEALPNARPSDGNIIVSIDKPMSGIGTAFAIDDKGTWLTARHVVDSCDTVGLNLGGGKFIKTGAPRISKSSDVAILISDWKRQPLAPDFSSQRHLGEHGFFLGFPQGRPGEAAGKLIGRKKLVVRGRYRSTEKVLAWAEIGRTRGLKGTLGGLSGAPALDSDGEVIGIVAAESPRRGRIYTVAPSTLSSLLQNRVRTGPGKAMSSANYGRTADDLRRSRRIAQVLCEVK